MEVVGADLSEIADAVGTDGVAAIDPRIFARRLRPYFRNIERFTKLRNNNLPMPHNGWKDVWNMVTYSHGPPKKTLPHNNIYPENLPSDANIPRTFKHILELGTWFEAIAMGVEAEFANRGRLRSCVVRDDAKESYLHSRVLFVSDDASTKRLVASPDDLWPYLGEHQDNKSLFTVGAAQIGARFVMPDGSIECAPDDAIVVIAGGKCAQAFVDPPPILFHDSTIAAGRSRAAFYRFYVPYAIDLAALSPFAAFPEMPRHRSQLQIVELSPSR